MESFLLRFKLLHRTFSDDCFISGGKPSKRENILNINFLILVELSFVLLDFILKLILLHKN